MPAYYYYLERFYYSISIFLPMLMFALKTPRRKHFSIRLVSCLIVTAIIDVIAAFFLSQPTVYPFAQTSTFTVVYFAFEFLLGISLCIICFEENFMCALYCSIAGYCIQHIWGRIADYTIYRIINRFIPDLLPIRYLFGLLILVGFCVGFYFLFLKKMSPTGGNYALNNTAQIIVAFVVVGVNIVFNTYGFGGLDKVAKYVESSDGNGQAILSSLYFIASFMSAFSAFLCLFILMSLYISKTILDEKKELNRMLDQQKVKFESEKETINLVNIKVHDLKHQLAAMDGKLSEEEIKETIHSVNIYDSLFRTGNEAIDIVLASKHSILEKNEISMTCSLDGKLLSFIPAYEIYSIFGNAVDNAIESVFSLPKEKRIIHITQEHHGNFLSVKIQNFFQNKIELKDGLPKTTKEDNGYHGFGVKSMKMLMEKHGGSLSISTQNDLFTLVLLFVLKN